MKRIIVAILSLSILTSHDMYLKLDQFFLEPQAESVIQLFNGTFNRSDNAISRDRMLDVSMVGNGKRHQMDSTAWYEKDNTTYLRFTAESQGTWITGVSTRPRTLGMSAESFNNYLEHDGVLDMLNLRKQNGSNADSAVERYSKHVKTVFQVGEKRTDDYKIELGYPIEFILLENPYDLHAGHSIPVKLFFNQQPLKNQLVYVGSKLATITHTHDEQTHSHGENADHQHDELKQFRTDENGLVNVPITSEGIWYLRTIHLVESNEEGLTHESNWATITFAVGGGHSHDPDHLLADGIPSYLYLLFSLLLIVALFYYFKRKQ